MILYHKKLVDTSSFIIKAKHTTGFTFTLPLIAWAYTYNFQVNWGDGTISQVTSQTDTDKVHTYATGDNGGLPWIITMTGTLEGWAGNTTGSKEYIVEVVQWGTTGFKSISMQNCAKLTTCLGILTTSQTSYASMFAGCSLLSSIDVSNWDVSNVVSFGAGYNSGMFSSCFSLTSVDTSNWSFNTSSNISFAGVFYNCSNLTSIGSTTNWNTSKFTTLNDTFNGCVKLTTLDTSNWDVSNVVVLAQAFRACTVLNQIDVTGWNVTKVTNFYCCFGICKNFTSLDTSGWVFNASSNIDFSRVFEGCSNLTSIGSTTNWNTSKFTTLLATFNGCGKLTTLDTSNWDTSSITNCSYMCNGCTLLTSAMPNMKWWNRSPAIPTYSACFRGATNILNYADIPTAWK